MTTLIVIVVIVLTYLYATGVWLVYRFLDGMYDADEPGARITVAILWPTIFVPTVLVFLTAWCVIQIARPIRRLCRKRRLGRKTAIVLLIACLLAGCGKHLPQREWEDAGTITDVSFVPGGFFAKPATTIRTTKGVFIVSYKVSCRIGAQCWLEHAEFVWLHIDGVEARYALHGVTKPVPQAHTSPDASEAQNSEHAQTGVRMDGTRN